MTVKEVKDMTNDELIFNIAYRFDDKAVVKNVMVIPKKTQKDMTLMLKELAERGVINDVDSFLTEWQK